MHTTMESERNDTVLVCSIFEGQRSSSEHSILALMLTIIEDRAISAKGDW